MGTRISPETSEGRLMAPQIDRNRARKEQVFKKLRREILAARLKVTLDQQLNRETSPSVKRLSEMKLPPRLRSRPLPRPGTVSRWTWLDREEEFSIPTPSRRRSKDVA